MISLRRFLRFGSGAALCAGLVVTGTAGAQAPGGTAVTERPAPAVGDSVEGTAPSAPRTAPAPEVTPPTPASAAPAGALAAGPRLVPGRDDAEWRDLFAKLAAQGAVRSTFTEQRFFPFRRQAVVLHGEMRHAPGHGLSLHYTDPEDQVMIVDEKGLVMRDTHGRSRELAADPHAPRMDTVLLPVLRFDLPALLRYFDVRAARNGAEWRVDFEPATPELARQLSTVTVFGTGDRITQLEFHRAANQRVVVQINRTETHVVFSPEELRRFFR